MCRVLKNRTTETVGWVEPNPTEKSSIWIALAAYVLLDVPDIPVKLNTSLSVCSITTSSPTLLR